MIETKSENSLSALVAQLKSKPHTPLQLCFSLWKSGFVGAALNISFMSLALPFVVLIFLLALDWSASPSPAPPDQLGAHVKFSAALPTWFICSAVLVVFISVVHGMYVRLKLWLIVVALLFLGSVPPLLSVLSWVTQLELKVQVYLWVIYFVFCAAVPKIRKLLERDVSEVSSAPTRSHRRSLKESIRAWRGAIPAWLDDLVSGRWVPNIHERVKEIYRSNEDLRSQIKSPSPPVDTRLADIGSDFKAWNDATKLLISILAGLAVISAIFRDERVPYEEAFKILWVLFLLVPALSCVYMEAFRRQCEREWKIIEESSAPEKSPHASEETAENP